MVWRKMLESRMDKMGFACNRNWSFALATQTNIRTHRNFQRRSSIMGSMMGVPNWLSLVVALGAFLYISKDSWTGQLGKWRDKIGI